MAQDTREKIIRFYKGTEGEDAAIRMIDLAYQALKNRKYKLTGFLTPYEQEIAGTIANSVGDIIATKESARIIVDKKMADYFINNLNKIGDASVKVTIDELENIAPKEEKCKEIRATAASLRIDSIAAAGFGMSRSKAAADIAADKMKLNWQSVKNAAQSIKEGDIISMRGRGRVEVVEIKGLTKKGRTSVLLKRYF